jgi:hypothetical protein
MTLEKSAWQSRFAKADTYKESQMLQAEIWSVIDVINQTTGCCNQNVDFGRAAKQSTEVSMVRAEIRQHSLLCLLVLNDGVLLMREAVLTSSAADLTLS